MKIDDQLRTPSEQGGKTKVNQQTDSVNNPETIASTLLPYLGKDYAANPIAVRKKLLTDDSYLNRAVSNLLVIDDEQDEYYRNNPEEYNTKFIDLKNRITNKLAAEVSVGQTIKEAVVKRAGDLHYGSPDFNLDISQVKDIIKNDPKKYMGFALIDDEKNIQLEDKGLEVKIANTPELFNALMGDKFEAFSQEVNKKNNFGVIDQANPDDMGEAYAVYDKFGSEGLTQYANYKKYNPDQPLEEQSPSVQDAVQFMNHAKSGGKTPFQTMSDFFGNEESELGRFEFTPIKKSIEMQKDIPMDYNAFSSMYHTDTNKKLGLEDEPDVLGFVNKMKEEELRTRGERSGFRNFVSDKFESNDEGIYETGSVFSYFEKAFQAFDPEKREERKNLDITKNQPSPIKLREATDEEIIKELKDGRTEKSGKIYSAYIQQLVSQAEQGEAFNMNDLINNIIVNSGGEYEIDGAKKYAVNYDEMPDQAKDAVNALHYSDDYNSMFYQKGDQLFFEPNYQDRLKKTAFSKKVVGDAFWEEQVYMEDGEIKSRSVPNSSIDSSFLNNVQGLTLGVARGLVNIGDSIFDFKRVLNSTEDALEKVGIEGKFVQGMRDKLITLQEDVVDEQVGSANVYDLPVIGDIKSRAAWAMLGDMASYLGSAYKIGKSSINQVKNMSRNKNISLTSLGLSFSPAKKGTKVGKALDAFKSRELAAKARGIKTPTQAFLNIEIGDNVLTALSPEYSLYGSGAIDMAGKAMGIEDMTTEASYDRTNRFGQVAVDVFTNLAITNLLDFGLAGVRFGANKAQMMVNPNATGKGWKYNKKGDDYIKLNKSEYNLKNGFSPDIRRAFSNLIDDMGQLEKGRMSDSFKNTYGAGLLKSNPELTETLADVVNGFVSMNDEIIPNLKNVFRDGLRAADEGQNLELRSAKEYDELAEAQYRTFIKDLGDEMYYQLGSGTSPNNLRYDVADLLTESVPTIKQLEFKDQSGKNHKTMSLIEAQELAGNDAGKIIRKVGDAYEVHTVNPNSWRLEVANHMFNKEIDERFANTFEEVLNKKGLKINSTDEVVQEEIGRLMDLHQAVVGKKVMSNGKEARIIDIDKDGFIVRYKDDGKIEGNVKVATKFGDVGQENTVIEPPKELMKGKSKKPKAKKKTEVITKKTVDGLVAEAEIKESFVDVKPIVVDETLEKVGLHSKYIQPILEKAGYKTNTSKVARKIATLLGSDGSDRFEMLGKNKADIKLFSHKKVSKKGLPKDVVIKNVTDGMTEHYVTVKNTSPNSIPTVWVRDDAGNLVYNPEFARINPNLTKRSDGSLQMYEKKKRKDRNSGRMVDAYVPVKEGEQGVYLNIQKPTNDMRLSQDGIIQKNVDAFRVDVTEGEAYIPVNEVQQVIDPSRIKSSDYTTSRGKADVISVKNDEPTKKGLFDDVKGGLQARLIPPMIGDPLISTIAGAVIDHNTEEDTHYAKIGFMMGLGGRKMAGMIKKKYSPWVSGRAGKVDGNPFKEGDAHILAEQNMLDKESLGDLLPSDKYVTPEVVKDTKTKLKDFEKRVGSVVTNTFNRLRFNKFIQSEFSNLRNTYSPAARKMYDFMNGFSDSINKYTSMAGKNYNDIVYENEFERLILEGVDKGAAKDQALTLARGADEKFFNEDMFTIAEDVMTKFNPKFSEMSPDLRKQRGKEAFEESFSRVMHGGANKADDLARIEDNLLLNYYYGIDTKLKDIDKAFLENPLVKAQIKAHRKYFNHTMGEWLGTIDGQINTLINAVSREHPLGRKLFGAMMESKETPEAFKKSLNKAERKAYTNFTNEPAVVDAMPLYRARRKFTEALDGKYMPQSVNAEKMGKEMNRWVNHKIKTDEKFSKLTPSAQKEAFQLEIGRKIMKINYPDSDKKMIDFESTDLSNPDLQVYMNNSKATVLNKLRSMARSSINRTSSSDDIATNVSEIESWIKEGTKNNPDGSTSKFYYVEVPEDRKGFLDEYNRTKALDVYSRINNSPDVVTSNFLEKPRNMVLPLEIVNTDIKATSMKYGTDVGRRLHNVKNGVFNDNDLNRKFITPILDGLENPEDGKRMKDRLQSSYNIVNKIYGKDQKEIDKFIANNRISSAFTKFFFSAYASSIQAYNSFEGFVVTPMLTSFRNTLKVSKMMEMNPVARENYKNMLLTNDIIDRHIGSYNESLEFIENMSFENGAQASENTVNNVSNWSGNFSVGKSIRKKLDVAEPQGHLSTLPVFGGSFIDSNIFNSAKNFAAHLAEATELAEAAHRLVNNPDLAATTLGKDALYKGKSTLPRIKSKLATLGIEDVDKFIEQNHMYREALSNLETSKNFDVEFRDTNPEFYDNIVHLARMATENMHGTNKMNRPVKWQTPAGRFITLFSSYAQNFGLQHFQKRIRFPIGEWHNKYDSVLKTNNDYIANPINMLEIAKFAKTGNAKPLMDRGFTKEMVDELPIDAYLQMTAKTAAMLGVSTVGYFTLDLVKDVVGYVPNKIANDYLERDNEQFERIKTWTYPDPYSGEPKSWADMFQNDDEMLDDFLLTMQFGAGLGVQTGLLGKYGDIGGSANRVAREGITSLSPTTAEANRLGMFIAKNVSDENTKFLSTDTASDFAETALRFIPYFGGGIFGEARKALFDREPARRPSSDSGFELDMDMGGGLEDLDIDFEFNLD